MSDFLLEVKNVTKEFPGTKALDNVCLQVKKGEVHALCGENGAGKSTLMNIIGGVFSPTTGEMNFDGVGFVPKNPKNAQDLGIGFVHQELCLCTHLTVAENIFMGRLPHVNGMIDYVKLWKDADEILARFNASFKSTVLVSTLTVSEQQIVEIAKSVSLTCKLLILDEPTSSLTDKETERLFSVVKDLKDAGISVLYISHRMAEIFEICDNVTVFKDGTYVTTMKTADISSDDIIKAMVGRELGKLYPAKSSEISEENVLEVKNLTGGKFQNITFSLKKGEILGFAGLVGAGRSEIMRSLCAIDKRHAGEVFLNGEKKKFANYKDAINSGICYLTEDRKLQGLFLGMSIRSNMASANLKGVSRGLWIDEEKEASLAENYVGQLAIKLAGIEYPISTLSGGNQQKCLIGKWLSLQPKVIIMDEPTRGIDVGAKSEIHNLLRQLAESGVGVIVVSSELPEIIGLADRVAVIHEGDLAGVVCGDGCTEENIMKLASGAELTIGVNR